jgi:hypothetical protein
MFPRLLLLLSLLLLPQTFLAEQSESVKRGAPDSCPVTKASDRPFIPPWPYDAEPYPGSSWFGSDRLWTALPANGIWRGVHFSTIDPASGSKMDWWREAKESWWRQGHDWGADSVPKLKITGRRLDSRAPPLVAEVAGAAVTKVRDTYVMVGYNFPTLGCWEITGRYEDDELTFVVWVAKSSAAPSR